MFVELWGWPVVDEVIEPGSWLRKEVVGPILRIDCGYFPIHINSEAVDAVVPANFYSEKIIQGWTPPGVVGTLIKEWSTVCLRSGDKFFVKGTAEEVLVCLGKGS